MNTAIIFIKNDKELELAKAKILDKNLIEYTLNTLSKLDLDNIYLVGGGELNVSGLTCRDDVNEIINDLKNLDGKCLLLSPFYPLASVSDYSNLLNSTDTDGALSLDLDGTCSMFMLPNDRLDSFEDVDFSTLEIEESNATRVKSYEDIPDFTDEIKIRINLKHINNGVNIIDPYTTYISQDVVIDKYTTIYPNVVIEGKCLIGKNNSITSGSHLKDVVIGDNNEILNSRITDSIIHSEVTVGPTSHIRNSSEILSGVKIDNFVEINNSKIGKLTRVAHQAYLANALIGSDVTIGCGVITIDYDANRKYATVIKDHGFIGANSNLIAPVTIGEYSMVAAGSTIEEDVKDGDLAIARLYQTNKKGYGYKYINKEN